MIVKFYKILRLCALVI